MANRWNSDDEYKEWSEDDSNDEGDSDFDSYDDDSGFDADDETVTVECPKCGCDMYEDAEQCPLCGEWIIQKPTAFTGKPGWYILLALIGIIATIVMLLFPAFLGFQAWNAGH